MAKTSVFDRPHFPRLLCTENPLLQDLKDGFPPIKGLPEGKVRIRLRADEIAPIVHVKTEDGIRAFLVFVEEDGSLSKGPEVAANYRGIQAPIEPSSCPDEVTVRDQAQACANASGKKWVWYAAADGTYHHKPAEIRHFVQLNDVTLAGEIVVLARPSMKEVYRLVWPVLSSRSPSATVTP